MTAKARFQSPPRRRISRRRGFTLLEIVVVVTIVALLAAFIAPRLLGRVGQSRQSVAQSEVRSIAQQVHLWMLDNGHGMLPDDFRLEVLTTGPNAPFRPGDLKDPWGRDYVLIAPGRVNSDFDIVSYGRDGEPGGEGEDMDVVN